jgi:hypothetical protein
MNVTLKPLRFTPNAGARGTTLQLDVARGTLSSEVCVFDTRGNFIERLISRTELNSPWGLVSMFETRSAQSSIASLSQTSLTLHFENIAGTRLHRLFSTDRSPYIDPVQRTGAADSRQTQSEGIEAVFSVARKPVTQRTCERRGKLGESHADQKLFFLWCGSVVVSLLLLAAIRPLAAETPSDAERLQKFEQAVSQLQKRTAELEQEVAGLKKRTTWAPVLGPDGKAKADVTSDGKKYLI